MQKDSQNWDRNTLTNHARSTGDTGLRAQAEIDIRKIESINYVAEKIEKASEASDKLAKRVFWLDIILAIATIVIAGTALAGLIND